MSKRKQPRELKLTVVRSNAAEKSAAVASRIGDCRGAVKLAIEAILSADPEQIDAAMGSLCLAERELERLAGDMDAAQTVRAGKPSAAAVVN